MRTPEEVALRIKAELATLVEQGLPADAAAQAEECAGKICGLLGEYMFPGTLALGIVGGLVEEMFDEHDV